jgi:2'-5' RNA ligase
VVTAAADGSHTQGCMIALMPTAEDAERLAIPGGEPAEELHLTLFFLGDDGASWTEDQRNELEGILRPLAELYELGPVQAKAFGAAHWNGGGDYPCWVWNVGDAEPGEHVPLDGLLKVRACVTEALESTHERPELPSQHSPWAAHVCAAYSDDPALLPELEQRLGPVTFDRIRLSFGDEDRDIPLTGDAVTAAAGPLRREPTELELASRADFASVYTEWEAATAGAVKALKSVTAAWRLDLRQQITRDLADGDIDAVLGLSLDQQAATATLLDLMEEFAIKSGRACQREAEAQGVRVPNWSLPDGDEDAVTAALTGRRLLVSVAELVSDLMSGALLTAAKRKLSGLLRSSRPTEQIASEVDRELAEVDDSSVRASVGSAMTAAQNAGRHAVMDAAPPASSYVASEILDNRTCGPCKTIDGRTFATLDAAVAEYPVMGYRDCTGARYGNACRGFLVAVWQEVRQDATTASADQAEEDAMPWHKVHDHADCPSDKPWAVVKDSDGEVSGCHKTESDADDQLAALYAAEGDHAVTSATATEATESLSKGEPNPGTPKDKRLKENKQSTAEEKQCPPGMEPGPDGECVKTGEKTAGQAEALAHGAAADAQVVEGKPLDQMGDGQTAPWRGPLTVEGIETGDGREFKPDALTWADLPLPLRWNIEDSHGGEPRTKAVNVGRIDKIWREDNGLIMGEGVLDLSDDNGRAAHNKIKGQFLRGVSVDVDSIKDADMELVWPADPDSDGEGPDPFDMLFASPEKVVFNKGRIRAATLVDIPAFAEAYIALLDEDGAVVAGGTPAGAVRETRVPRARTLTVEAPLRPPAGWFTNPGLSVPTGITVTPDGRVYGHAALWGTCHIGQEGVCVTPPHEEAHPYFMTGNVWTEDGASVGVGQITVGTGHAPLSYGYRAAADHYDNTGAAVADVAVGNDGHGIWVAGSIRPGTPESRIHELRAAGQVSGDWRRIGGSLRLVGLLAVNVPGFPVPKLKTRTALGQQLALVAAGIPQLTESMTEDELDQWAYRRVLTALSRKVHGEE